MARPLARLDLIALRSDACHLALTAVGECASKEDVLGWVLFFERVQLDGAAALEGIYGSPKVAKMRIIGVVK